MNQLRAHVIDLVSRPRWGAACVESLSKIGIAASIFPAVDGPGGQRTDLEVDEDVFIQNMKGRRPTAGEIGCFASYRALAKDAISGKLAPAHQMLPDWWLVFEDDAVPVGDISAVSIFALALKADSQGINYINLYPGIRARRATDEPTRLEIKSGKEIRSHAQLFHRSALLAMTNWTMRVPIDVALSRSDAISYGVIWGRSYFSHRKLGAGIESISSERLALEKQTAMADPLGLNVRAAKKWAIEVTKPVSVVTICHNRIDHLEAALFSWVNHPAVEECIIVDWASDKPVHQSPVVMRGIKEGKVRVIRMVSDEIFNVGQAVNLGLSYVTKDIVAKMDCDIVWHDYCVATEIVRDISAGKYGLVRLPVIEGQIGSFFASRTALLSVKGFREDLRGYGWEDMDIFKRLGGVPSMVLTKTSMFAGHIPHGDERCPVLDHFLFKNKKESNLANERRLKHAEITDRRTYTTLADNDGVVTVEMDGRTVCGPLMDVSHWDKLFSPYRGLKTNAIPNHGNVGDHLIWRATLDIYALYDISVEVDGNVDIHMWPGGGSMGDMYPACIAARETIAGKSIADGRPVVSLPQSYNTTDTTLPATARLTVRETESLRYAPGAEIFHDLALSLRAVAFLPKRKDEVGYFFRADKESLVDKPATNLGDPVNFSMCVEDYLRLAASYREIHTDRLHFAIACLLVGTDVTLYPNSYHKNKAVFEYSLKALGCKLATNDNS